MLTFLAVCSILFLFLCWDVLALIFRLFGVKMPFMFELMMKEGNRPLTKEEKDCFYAQEMEKRRQKRKENKSRRR